jgi:hypothetical protein
MVVLDPRVWVAERAPRTLSVAARRPGFWALHVCVCDGDEGICTPSPSRSGMPVWRTGDHCSGAETRSMRKERAQRICWCRYNCENDSMVNVLVGSSTELTALLM